MVTPKVSIIVPVYKAEKYISKCMHSLFNQTLQELEIIVIDDCSPDKSIEIVKQVITEYPKRLNQLKLIRNESNLGVGQTRQKGIDSATGAYIIHCDPDDWIDPTLYEEMLNYALQNDADIVICDFIKEYGDNYQRMPQVCSQNKSEMFATIATRQLHMSLCNKLIRKEIYQKFRFQPHINMWEDMAICPLMLLEANKVVHIENACYHYVIDNQQSIVNSTNIATIKSQIKAVEYLTDKIYQNNYDKTINLIDLDLLHWTAILGLLLNMNDENGKMWNETFSEQISHYKSFNMPQMYKILTWLAINKHYRVVRLLVRLRENKHIWKLISLLKKV